MTPRTARTSLDAPPVEGHCEVTSVSEAQKRVHRLHARTVGSGRERDAPPPAGEPRTQRQPASDRLEDMAEAPHRRIVACRSGRSGRHRLHTHLPNARREAAHRRWTRTTRPDERRSPGRSGCREVTPLDAAIQDGSPRSSPGELVRQLRESGARADARNRAVAAHGAERGASEGSSVKAGARDPAPEEPRPARGRRGRGGDGPQSGGGRGPRRERGIPSRPTRRT